MDDKKSRLDNTIKLISEVLEKNKENPKVKEAYEQIQKLKEKRNIE